jgi:uncharacterized protein YjbI with pentapeptide repeats
MTSKLRSWWQKTSKPRLVLIITLLVILFVLLIGGYFFNWTWTGFGPYTPPTSNFQREKTLYDWLQLAIIPVALAVGIWWLNRLQQQRDQRLADQRAQLEREAAEKQAQVEREAAEERKEAEQKAANERYENELKIAHDNQRAATLEAYLDKMSELLLNKDNPLRESKPEDEVRQIARVRTLTVLPRLNANRKRSVLHFLYESDLIDKDKRIIDLNGADLVEADLSGIVLCDAVLSGANLAGANLVGADLARVNLSTADLHRADMREVNLKEANLFFANMKGADLSRSSLRNADLRNADLSKANLDGAVLDAAALDGANLLEAKVTTEQLDQTMSLKGATKPEVTKHD